MTMSMGRWSIASAKAGFSRLVLEARQAPQMIENRGRPVAVVLSTAEYERLAAAQQGAARWLAVMDSSAEIRAEGGVDLEIPTRTARPSALGSKGTRR